jgi:hypothetical protein
VASLTQLRLDKVPIPPDVARTGDQDEGSHVRASSRSSVPPGSSAWSSNHRNVLILRMAARFPSGLHCRKRATEQLGGGER